MYKLLTFREDWEDEFDIIATAVMTDLEYINWTLLTNSELNPDYENENKEYLDKLSTRKLVQEEITKAGYENIYKAYDADPIKFKHLYRRYNNAYVYEKPDKYFSNIYAYTGNCGEAFEKQFNEYHYNYELVNNHIVEVIDVSEEFFNTYKKSDLQNFVMCNVFEND